MSEIEKMYENAGSKGCCKYAEYGYEGEEGIWYYCTKESKECWTYPNGDADCVEKGNPSFTAEKQIELIKWLGKLAGKLEISSNYNDTQYLLYFYLNRKTRDEILPNMSTGRSENFEESLAGLVNSLWQSLSEKERKQIKEILE